MKQVQTGPERTKGGDANKSLGKERQVKRDHTHWSGRVAHVLAFTWKYDWDPKAFSNTCHSYTLYIIYSSSNTYFVLLVATGTL